MSLRDQLVAECHHLQISIHPDTDWEVNLVSLEYVADPEFQNVPTTLSKFQVIEQLTIRNSVWSQLPTDLVALKNVKRLKLFLSNATSVDGISSLKGLISLGIYTPRLNELPPDLNMLTNLKFLAIKADITDLPATMTEMDSLKILYLECPRFSEKTEEIPTIKQLKEAIEVRFANFFTGQT